MAPLPEEGLTSVQNWMRPNPRPADPWPPIEFSPLPDSLELVDLPMGEPTPILSRQGAARWRCLGALSAIYRTGIDSASCWQSLADWKQTLRLGELDTADRYRFVSWFLQRVDEFEPVQIAKLAKWLFDSGLSDVDRLTRWAEERDEIDAVPATIRLARAPFVSDLRTELKHVIRDARESAGRKL